MRVVVTAMLMMLVLAGCGGSGPSLDNRVLQLTMTYSISGPVEAVLNGGNGAAAAGAEVECRLTASGRPVLGKAVANDTGAFVIELDLALLPQQLPDADAFRTLNETVECRSGSGSWESPLRQPVLRIE